MPKMPSVTTLPSFSLPSLPAPSPPAAKRAEPDLDATLQEAREARERFLQKEGLAPSKPAAQPRPSASPSARPRSCGAKESGCLQSERVKGASYMPAWAYPPALKPRDAAKALNRALKACGATGVDTATVAGGALRLTARFSTGFLGMTTDTAEFLLDPSTTAVAFRATSPGDEGRARGRMTRLRTRLKWREIPA